VKPVRTGSKSQRCDAPISTDCIKWSGADLCFNVCDDASLTEILQAAFKCPDNAECYTGTWVPFHTSISTSGSGAGYSWTIGTFGVGNTGNPSYKWTKEGDLLLRGGLVLNFVTSADKLYVDIPLVNLPVSCFPANWKHNQAVLTTVDMFPNNRDVIPMRAQVYIDHPSGTLYLNYTFVNQSGYNPMRLEIDLGGVRFNLA
jgi:hypothetical protein